MQARQSESQSGPDAEHLTPSAGDGLPAIRLSAFVLTKANSQLGSENTAKPLSPIAI